MKQNKTIHSALSLTAATLLITATPGSATAGLEPFIGEISYVKTPAQPPLPLQ